MQLSLSYYPNHPTIPILLLHLLLLYLLLLYVSYHGGNTPTGHRGNEIDHRIGPFVKRCMFETSHGSIPYDRLTTFQGLGEEIDRLGGGGEIKGMEG